MTDLTWTAGQHDLPRPPRAPKLPLLGNALDFFNRPTTFLEENVAKLGPVFEIDTVFQKYIVMAGLEANRFLAQHSEDYFTSVPLFGDFAGEMGSRNFLVAVDGEEHRHMRKALARGYSKRGVAPHLDNFLTLTEARVDGWADGDVILVREQLARLVAEQLGMALTGFSSDALFEDIRYYLNALMSIFVIKQWPRLMLRMPRYTRAKGNVMAMAREVIARHRDGDEALNPDLVDDLLAATDLHGQPLSEGDILAAVIGPYFAGIDTVASTMGFMLYEVLKHPDVYAAIQQEARTHFAAGVPSWRELPKLMPTLYGATIETLRMHPVAPFTPRGVIQPFSFAGYQIEAGDYVMVLNTLLHNDPAYFPEPERFDVTRYWPGREEHKQGQGIFAPYTLGPHTCLGAGVAELQLMLTVGELLRHADFEIVPAEYELVTRMLPIPGPDPKFKVRVVKGN